MEGRGHHWWALVVGEWGLSSALALAVSGCRCVHGRSSCLWVLVVSVGAHYSFVGDCPSSAAGGVCWWLWLVGSCLRCRCHGGQYRACGVVVALVGVIAVGVVVVVLVVVAATVVVAVVVVVVVVVAVVIVALVVVLVVCRWCGC